MNTSQNKASLKIAEAIKATGVITPPPQIRDLLRLAHAGDGSKKLIAQIAALDANQPKFKVRAAVKELIDTLKSEGGAMGRENRVAFTGSPKPMDVQLKKIRRKEIKDQAKGKK